MGLPFPFLPSHGQCRLYLVVLANHPMRFSCVPRWLTEELWQNSTRSPYPRVLWRPRAPGLPQTVIYSFHSQQHVITNGSQKTHHWCYVLLTLISSHLLSSPLFSNSPFPSSLSNLLSTTPLLSHFSFVAASPLLSLPLRFLKRVV